MQCCPVFLPFIIFCNLVLCENQSEKRNSKNGLALLGVVRDFKIGDNNFFTLPGYLISPVIIVPSGKPKESGTTNKLEEGEADEVSDIKVKQDRNVEDNFRQALDRGANKKDLRQVQEDTTPIQNDDDMDNATTETTTNEIEIITTVTATFVEQNTTQESTTVRLPTTRPHGVYPNSVYNNQHIASLMITVKSPDNMLLPPLANENWKNFTRNPDVGILKENTTMPVSPASLNIGENPLVKVTDSPIKGVYPASLYNNAEIDQLSITTNSYTNELPLPPPQDDRWRAFSSTKMLPMSNEFRPLAGLYFDGFLHRPMLKASGFVPYNNYL